MIKTIYQGNINLYYGLSTDTKPTPPNASRFYEMDTKSCYMYDETNTQWRSIGSSGGAQKFIGMWDCTTGLPSTTVASGTSYTASSYYIVSAVSNTTNYKPDGASYSGSASTVVETANISVGCTYYYNGTAWGLIQAPASTAAGVQYLTTAPTADNTDGLKFVVLTSDPTTKYNGYFYIITSA